MVHALSARYQLVYSYNVAYHIVLTLLVWWYFSCVVYPLLYNLIPSFMKIGISLIIWYTARYLPYKPMLYQLSICSGTGCWYGMLFRGIGYTVYHVLEARRILSSVLSAV